MTIKKADKHFEVRSKGGKARWAKVQSKKARSEIMRNVGKKRWE